MAINAITVSELSSFSTNAAAAPTFQAVDTATGAYVDVKGKRVDKLVICVNSQTTTTTARSVVIGAGYYTDKSLGAKTVSLSSDPLVEYVVAEWARHKDSNERINITCTGSTTVTSVAAIILP